MVGSGCDWEERRGRSRRVRVVRREGRGGGTVGRCFPHRRRLVGIRHGDGEDGKMCDLFRMIVVVNVIDVIIIIIAVVIGMGVAGVGMVVVLVGRGVGSKDVPVGSDDRVAFRLEDKEGIARNTWKVRVGRRMMMSADSSALCKGRGGRVGGRVGGGVGEGGGEGEGGRA